MKLLKILFSKIRPTLRKVLKAIYRIIYRCAPTVAERIKIKFKKQRTRRINYHSISDLTKCIKKNIHILPDNIDLVVGNPRSGMIPAYSIALFLNTQACSLTSLLTPPIGTWEWGHGERHIPRKNNEKKHILVVDDSVNTGTALNKIKEKLSHIDLSNYEIEFLAIYATEKSKHLVDYHFEIVEQPRLFEWNCINHSFTTSACFDMDGVLCVDPTHEQNDDGEKYIDFMKNAKPLYIPTYEIHSIVTSRLEKYRPQTEEWLKTHDIKYKHLYMLDLPTAELRRKLNCHGKFKAKIFSQLMDCSHFIESNRAQAIEIAKISRKQCICVETGECFGG